MQGKYIVIPALMLFAITSNVIAQTDSKEAQADADEKTRVGTCADAKSQMEYFCEKKESNSNDMMIGFNACNNAKKNVKEACEGVVEADIEYKFNKKE